MSRKQFSTVDMPDKGVIFRPHANGTVYVYYTLRAFRNSKGKPTSEVAAIGKKDPDTGRLIPNKRYFELFPPLRLRDEPLPVADKNHGTVFVMDALTRKIHLRACLKKAFPGIWREILTLAYFLATDGDIELWSDAEADTLDEPRLPFSLGSLQSTAIIDALRPRAQKTFFKCWASLRLDNDYQCFDINTRTTHADESFTVWLFVGQATGLPLYYNRLAFQDSLSDVDVRSVLHDADELGVRNMGFILEQQFPHSKSQWRVARQLAHFLAPFPYEQVQGLGSGGIKQRMRDPKFWRPEAQGYGAHIEHVVDRRSYWVHLLWDAETYAHDERAIYEAAADMAAPEEKRDAWIRTQLADAGYETFITNDARLPTDYIPELYERRHIIEDVFRQIQQLEKYRTLSPYIKQTKDGKSFLGFLAVVLRLAVLNATRADARTEDMSWSRIVAELARVRVVSDETGKLRATPRNRTQKLLLEVLGI
jgi:hypothetical protein